MLSAIEHKIARTWWGTWPWETGYYLPITEGDIYEYYKKIYSEWWAEIAFEVLSDYYTYPWSLDKQDDKCISHIYNQISHD